FYHPFETHFTAIIRRVQAGNAIIMQFLYFLRQNGSSAAAKNFNMPAAVFIQQVFHVFKKFNMASLVTGDSNAMRIFFNSTFHNFSYRPVMSEVNDLCTLTL